ncbi:hypothetical protein HBI88_043550 [Parastagonospora nodorum]|nr:hypothetical protein HBI97_052810 [Parastagonospora nodorum]KAH5885211.1 hypothetical protein HBI91_010410 [Parastagonospora nodorum]KAH5889438.1 hypothetical protein HBI92_100520 [Parastagonospora nodorum]KAH5942081.1 hypothetical protein HBI88_043550 [Parastagonospora nodorum]
MTDSLRARTPINLSAVLYEQSAARPGLSAEVSNMDLNFVPSIAFIPDVYMADSLRARTPINLSAVLYEQAAARTSLPAEVGNIDLNFVPGVAFIPDIHMANSLRARTLINLSTVLYEQAAAQTSLPAEVGNISPRVRTLINLSAVLYEQVDAQSGLPAEVSIIDLDFVPGVAFNAMGNVELTGDLLGDADRVNNNNNNIAPTLQFSPTALLNLDNIEELICVGKVKHTYVQAHTVPYPNLKKYLGNSTRNNHNNLNIMVTDPTGREFSRVDMKSSTRLWLTPRELGSIYVLRSVDEIWADVADVFDTVISKLDEVPTRELSSYIKTELYPHQKQALYFMLRDNSRKFYRLVITGEDTHCKQTIKKAYIMLPERASLILFMT